MRVLTLLLALVLGSACMPQVAGAQKQSVTGKLLLQLSFRPLLHIGDNPGQLVEAAFSSDYAKLLIAEFASVLRDSADPNCLKVRKPSTQGLDESARTILLRRGAQWIEVTNAAMDWPAFDANVAERAGSDAKAEMAQLRNDPDVQRFLALARRLAQSAVVELTVENLRRYALINRIRLVRGISPIETGNEALLKASEADDSYEKLDEFLTNRNSPELARYLRLALAAQEALEDALKSDAMLKLGPSVLMAGLDKDLADLCVAGASR
jgi:hypothetical protein